MTYLLDTDTIIYWLNGNQTINQKIAAVGFENLAFSIISKAELYYGAYNSAHVVRNIASIELLSNRMAMLPLNNESASHFGLIKSTLKKQGLPILDADIFIAAIAIANGLTLVTNNEKHYARIQDVQIENWIKK